MPRTWVTDAAGVIGKLFRSQDRLNLQIAARNQDFIPGFRDDVHARFDSFVVPKMAFFNHARPFMVERRRRLAEGKRIPKPSAVIERLDLKPDFGFEMILSTTLNYLGDKDTGELTGADPSVANVKRQKRRFVNIERMPFQGRNAARHSNEPFNGFHFAPARKLWRQRRR